jgi:hypothetical protein
MESAKDFLAFFDGEHSCGTAERGDVREWSAEKRKELRLLVGAEVPRLLQETGRDASAEDAATTPCDGGRRPSNAAARAEPSAARWFGAVERLEELCWGQ